MAVSEITRSDSFLSEVSWAKDMIVRIMECKMKGWPMGLHPRTSQPDELLAGFARRGLILAVYARLPTLSLGLPEAYVQNVGAIVNYVESMRQSEIMGANDKINELLALKAHGWSVGLSWPLGQPDDFARYFAVRGLPIAYHLRGNQDVGDDGAYDQNIATLNAYVLTVGAASVR
jgi:hypothetical protein